MARSEAFTLPELLVVVAVVAILAGIALGGEQEALARLQVESASRRVVLGLERGRSVAERLGRPCALSLNSQGWGEPSRGNLTACPGVVLSLGEGMESGEGLRLEHNLPAAVRFSSNGLVLDGGTVLVAHRATELTRCVVVSLPLGVARVGLYSEGACRPDPSL
jgi:prepilin-type N-terminal cleavage/methylation domain-containing protein